MDFTGKISIIIPCYNYGEYLAECLESVLQQSYPHWNVVVVDDGSSDNSANVASQYVARLPQQIKLIQTQNLGVSSARNTGIAESEGEFLLPLDADDRLLPQALERLVLKINENPRYGFAYGCLEHIGQIPGEANEWIPGPYLKSVFLMENMAPTTSLWRRSLWDQGVQYRDHFFFEDWDLWLQIIAKGFDAGYVPDPIFQYRFHLDGRYAEARYFYFQGLAQQVQANPSLYPQSEFQEFATRLLLNAPDCFSLPPVVLVPDQSKPEYTNLSGNLYQIGRSFCEAGHIVAAIGGFQVPLPDPGLHGIHIGPELDIKRTAELLERFGAGVLLLTDSDQELLCDWKQLPNVALVVQVSGQEDVQRLRDDCCRSWEEKRAKRSDLRQRLFQLSGDLLKSKNVGPPITVSISLGDHAPGAQGAGPSAYNRWSEDCKEDWLVLTEPTDLVSEVFLERLTSYLHSLGPEYIYQLKRFRLPPLAEHPTVTQSFDALKEITAPRRFAEDPSVLIVHRDTFQHLAGFDEGYQTPSLAFQDFIYRGSLQGIDSVWIQPGDLISKWSIATASQSDIQQDRERFDCLQRTVTSKSAPSRNLNLAAPAQNLSQREELLSKARLLAQEITADKISTADRVQLLLAWGQFLLTQEQLAAASQTFEDVLLLEPESSLAYEGLSVSFLKSGNTQLSGHLALKALALDPNSNNAQEVLRFLEDLQWA